MMSLEELRSELAGARKIHAVWAAWMRGEPEAANQPDERSRAEALGDADWHEHWVQVYDEVLERLQ